MLANLTLALALALSGAPADLSAAPLAGAPAPVQCAAARLDLPPAPLQVAGGEIGAQSVTCSATCNELPDISCTGWACSAVERSCPSQSGYVVCDGRYTFCSPPCPECTDGDFQEVETGGCCSCNDGDLWERQRCVNGQWETIDTFCSPGSFCPLCP